VGGEEGTRRRRSCDGWGNACRTEGDERHLPDCGRPQGVAGSSPMGGNSRPAHRERRGCGPRGALRAGTGRKASRASEAGLPAPVPLLSIMGGSRAEGPERRRSTPYRTTTYPVVNGGIALTHSTVSMALFMSSRPAGEPPGPVLAIRLHTGRSRPWLLCLSAAAGRLASRQRPHPRRPSCAAEADGKASLAADYVKNASAHSGAAGQLSLLRKLGRVSR
jgi:hypothetical protein